MHDAGLRPLACPAQVQERLQQGDTSLLDKLIWMGGSAIRGTDAYWSSCKTEAEAWVDYHIENKRGPPSLFMTGSCAEFQWDGLSDLLEETIYEVEGEAVDLRRDFSRRFRAVNDYAVIVVQFFQLRMDAYCSTVLKHQLGIAHYWFRYEFAKSRGQIHWHMFAIRGDKQPAAMLHERREALMRASVESEEAT